MDSIRALVDVVMRRHEEESEDTDQEVRSPSIGQGRQSSRVGISGSWLVKRRRSTRTSDGSLVPRFMARLQAAWDEMDAEAEAASRQETSREDEDELELELDASPDDASSTEGSRD